MAGMLPGVECARRRRFHQSGLGGWPDSPATSSGHGLTRRPSFCLYTSNHESHLSSISSSTVQRSPQSQAYCDEKLGDAAREAKGRLDERLRAQRKSESKRVVSSQQGSRNPQNTTSIELRELQIEVFGLKKKGSKRFTWVKLSRKSAEQDECAVCLEQYKEGDTLMHLPCAHRFHSKCLVPWLDKNQLCPCCRMEL